MNSPNSSNPITIIQNWYHEMCDGFWEHSYGVSIDTLDNPGWKIEIDLVSTPMESKIIQRIKIERNEKDWIHYWADNKKFHATGGPQNLYEMLEIFVKLISDK